MRLPSEMGSQMPGQALHCARKVPCAVTGSWARYPNTLNPDALVSRPAEHLRSRWTIVFGLDTPVPSLNAGRS